MRGRNPLEYTAIDLKSHGLTNLRGWKERTGFPMINVDKKHPEPEEEDPITTMDCDLSTTMVNGWKCSYVDQKMHANEARHKTLQRAMNNMPPSFKIVPDAPRRRPLRALQQAELKTYTSRRRKNEEANEVLGKRSRPTRRVERGELLESSSSSMK